MATCAICQRTAMDWGDVKHRASPVGLARARMSAEGGNSAPAGSMSCVSPLGRIIGLRLLSRRRFEAGGSPGVTSRDVLE